jgi:hypothetical protein
MLYSLNDENVKYPAKTIIVNCDIYTIETNKNLLDQDSMLADELQ